MRWFLLWVITWVTRWCCYQAEIWLSSTAQRCSALFLVLDLERIFSLVLHRVQYMYVQRHIFLSALRRLAQVFFMTQWENSNSNQARGTNIIVVHLDILKMSENLLYLTKSSLVFIWVNNRIEKKGLKRLFGIQVSSSTAWLGKRVWYRLPLECCVLINRAQIGGCRVETHRKSKNMPSATMLLHTHIVAGFCRFKSSYLCLYGNVH